MAAGPQLKQFNANVVQLNTNILEVEHLTETAREVAGDVKDALGVFGDIEFAARETKNTLRDLSKTLGIMLKVGPLKGLAKPLQDVLGKMADRAEKIEKKAGEIHDDLKDERDFARNAEAKLRDYETRLENLSKQVLSVYSVSSTLEQALDAVGDFVPAAVSGADSLAAAGNSALNPINTTYARLDTAVTGVVTAVDGATGIITTLNGISSAVNAVKRVIDPISEPLAFISSLLTPIQWAFDAVEFLFNLIVQPIIDKILEVTGIQGIIDDVTARLEGLLPDVTILDDVQQALLDALGGLKPGTIIDDIVEPFDRFVQDVIDKFIGALYPPGSDIVLGKDLDDSLTGDAGNNVLFGGPGDDTLSGLAGDDVLIGGEGLDTLIGGTGTDTAAFVGNISDYLVSQSTVDGSITVSHINPAGAPYADGTDLLFGVEELRFSNISISKDDLDRIKILASAGQSVGGAQRDFIFGSAGNDTIFGNGDSDYIDGGAGSDSINAGSGNDAVDPGTGNDTVIGGPGRDALQFLSLPSVQVLLASDPALAPFVTGYRISQFEDLLGSNGGDWLYGNLAANRLDGGNGNDILRGMSGNDHLIGGAGSDALFGDGGSDRADGGNDDDRYIAGGGADTFNGGAGTDLAWYGSSDSDFQMPGTLFDVANLLTGVRFNTSPIDTGLPFSSIVGDLNSGRVAKKNALGATVAVDILFDVEMLAGSQRGDQLFGSAGDDTLDGGAGNDMLNGRAGLNHLIGGVGDDTLINGVDGETLDGGSGNDVIKVSGQAVKGVLDRYIGGTGRDRLDYRGFDGFAVINLESGEIQHISLGTDDTASDLKTPAGDVSGIEEVFGGNGRNVIVGGSTVDNLLVGGDESDFLLSAPFAFGSDSFVSSDTLFGGKSNDWLFGNDGGDTLFGGLGNDRLLAGVGSGATGDSLVGEAGDDILFGSLSPADSKVRFEGGPGTDVVDYSAYDSTTGLRLDLLNGKASDHKYFDIENGIGSPFDDTVAGTNGANKLSGREGDDLVDGRLGDDFVYGRLGNDSLFGSAGNDTLNGGAGADLIVGGTGRDLASYAFFEYTSPNPFLESSYNPTDFDKEVILAYDIDLVSGLGRPFGQGLNGETAASDTLTGIADVLGGNLADTIAGNAAGSELDGGKGHDRLYGRAGDDTLVGGEGADRLVGQDGDDVLIGGPGNDVAIGGAGFDKLDFGDDTAGIVVNGAQRTVSHRTAVVTPVWDDDRTTGPRTEPTFNVILTPLSVYENNPENTTDPQFVDFIYSGSGFDSLRIFESVKTVTTIDRYSADTELVQGGRGSDTMTGSSAADRFEGGPGGDRLAGGQGSDWLYYLRSQAGVKVNLGTGVTSGGDAAGDTLAGFENVIGSELNDGLVGSGLANVMGGRAGDDVLWGLAGDDTIVGGPGRDVIDGGTGRDRVSYFDAAAGIRIDQLLPGSNSGEAASDTLVSVEDISGSAFNDTILGGNIANNLIGFGGNDVIAGREGNDTLSGGTGNDNLFGNGGNDRLDGQAGRDTIYGGTGRDTLVGGSDDDFLRGEADADKLFGSAGNDLMTGDAGSDSLFGGIGNDNLQGGGQNDLLQGGDGADTLFGGADVDVMAGGAGGDQLFGGTGGDQLLGDGGNDLLRGEGGNDSLFGGGNQDTLAGDSGADQLFGGTGNDRLFGATGNDLLRGEGGFDTLFGGSGDDTMAGDAGADQLFGEDGNDELFGGTGNDSLTGNAGRDTMTGGLGGDNFRFLAATDSAVSLNRDEIADFSSADGDLVDLSAIDANALVAGNQAFVFIGSAALSSTPGRVRFVTDGTDVFLALNVDGDVTAEMTLKLSGVTSMNGGDFIL